MTPIRRESIFGRRALAVLAGALVVGVLAWRPAVLAQGAPAASATHWVGTWAAPFVSRAPIPPPPNPAAAPAPQAAQPNAPAAPPAQAPQPPVNFKNQTVRQIVHTSIGGDRARVVLSNLFGTAGLQVGAAHVALRQKDAAIDPKSDRPLTFGGSPSMTIPAGAVVVSDPVTLTVPALADLVIDLYLPGDTAAGTSPLTTRGGAAQTNYISATGNHVGDADMPMAATTQAWFFLARVEVMASAQVGAVVGLGDSITAGARSTPDTNSRWLDQFAKRLLDPATGVKMGVLNAGIGGNRVLGDGNSALARFDRDVLTQTGVTHVIVVEGVNDIGARQNGATVADIIAGHQQLIERAHARGLKIYGGTILPFEGSTLALWTPENEAKRQAVNQWIKTGKAYDAVIDFDAAVRDPNAPTKIRADWDSGDHIHPNDIGYGAMAKAVDLALFGSRAGATRTSSR